MAVYKFNKKDKWDCEYFYRIYMKDEKKYIKFDHLFNREDGSYSYMDWVIYDYHDCKMLLDDFLEYDYLYQMHNLFEHAAFDRYVVEPEVAFNEANRVLSEYVDTPYEKLFICDINEYTRCGCYFGL